MLNLSKFYAQACRIIRQQTQKSFGIKPKLIKSNYRLLSLTMNVSKQAFIPSQVRRKKRVAAVCCLLSAAALIIML